MGKCDTCEKKKYGYLCEGCIHDPDAMDKYEPMTNADRIRAMSDEELAVFFADEIPHGDCYGCNLDCIHNDKGNFEDSCQNAWYGWLKQPVKEGE